jgi:hypothetical protein
MMATAALAARGDIIVACDKVMPSVWKLCDYSSDMKCHLLTEAGVRGGVVRQGVVDTPGTDFINAQKPCRLLKL